jgi:hypothetical protein
LERAAVLPVSTVERVWHLLEILLASALRRTLVSKISPSAKNNNHHHQQQQTTIKLLRPKYGFTQIFSTDLQLLTHFLPSKLDTTYSYVHSQSPNNRKIHINFAKYTFKTCGRKSPVTILASFC